MKTPELELLSALQALAQPAQAQGDLFPSFACAPDELALNFETALVAARQRADHSWSQLQRDAVEALDREMERVSGPLHPEIWEQPESLQHPQWERFRTLALAALQAFNWPIESPPPTRAIYVGPREI